MLEAQGSRRSCWIRFCISRAFLYHPRTCRSSCLWKLSISGRKHFRDAGRCLELLAWIRCVNCCCLRGTSRPCFRCMSVDISSHHGPWQQPVPGKLVSACSDLVRPPAASPLLFLCLYAAQLCLGTEPEISFSESPIYEMSSFLVHHTLTYRSQILEIDLGLTF